MAAIKIEGAVYLDTTHPSIDTPRYVFMSGKAADWDAYKLVVAHTIEVEADDFNVPAVLISGMEAKITSINLEAHRATQALRDRISKLQCIEA